MISKQIKDLMVEAGVPEQFTAHSTASAASYGLSPEEVLARGRWSGLRTWIGFYKKELSS